MNLFKKGIELIKSFFSRSNDDETVKSEIQTSTPVRIKKQPQSMNFPVGEGLSNVTTVAPGPRKSTLEAIKRGDEIKIVSPEQPKKISQQAVAKQVVGQQPQKTLSQNVTELAKKTPSVAFGFVKKKIEEDIQRTPLERLQYSLSMPYKIGKEIVKALPTIPGFIAKESLSIAQSITKPEEQIEVPQNLKFALGDEPIKSIQTRVKETNDIIKQLGGTDEQARNLSIFGVGLVTLSDIYAGPGKKNVEQKIVKEIENFVKDKAASEFIQAEAKKIAKIPAAQRQAAINTVIANVLDDGSDAFKVVKEARAITDTNAEAISKTVKPLTELDNAKNSMSKTQVSKPGGIERAIKELEAGTSKPVRVRTLENGELFIEDGTHRIEAAKQLGLKELPIEDVTKFYEEKKVGSIGLDKFEVDDKTKQGIIKIFQDAGVEQKIPQTEKQWLQAAKESEVLQKAITPEEVERANGMLLKTEQRIATISKELQQTTNAATRGELLRESISLSRNLNDELSARGRLLRAAGTGVSEDATVMDKLIKDISKHDVDIEKIVEAGKNIDFNSQKEVNDFYRQFVRPTFTDILTEYRYNNMLSNPRTQARNALSNVAQAIVTRPLVKFTTAGIDTFTSLLTGKDREYFFRDVPKYYYGLAKSIPESFSEFAATMRGQRIIGQQDVKAALNNIPTGKLPGIFTIPSRTLEAVDRMMQTLIIGGEMAGGKTAKEASKIAEYSLFRSGLDLTNKTGQGKLLSAIDNVTSKVDFLRKVPGGTWMIPFLRTPMNFAKMWLEYSPAGLFTMIGSERKKEQLAKTLIGSAITAYGAQLAFEDKTTWGVPRDPEAKSLFYASGKKPFSVKIGDNWVPMMYLGPWAFALAAPAAIKYHNEDDPGALTESNMEKIGKDLSALAYFYSQQTFMSGLGSFVELFGGDPDASVEKNLAFTAGQVIPFQGLVRYASTIVDPVYRKSNGFLEAIESGLPYMSKDLEPHTLPTGELSKRNKWSYLAPYDITQERPEYDNMLRVRNQELQSNAIRNEVDKETQKKAFNIVQTLFSATDDNTIIESLKPMKNNPALKSAVKSMIKKQAGYQAGTIQPYLILEPTDRAELIHTKVIMAQEGGKKEEEELIDMLNDLKEANLWTEKERSALQELFKKYPIAEVKQPDL